MHMIVVSIAAYVHSCIINSISYQVRIMDINILEKVKRLAIIAMVSDDELMDILVLKGGNAIDLIYQVSGRASIDIDF